MDSQQLIAKVRELMDTACVRQVRGGKHQKFHGGRMDAFQEILCYIDPEFRKSLGIETEADIEDIFGNDPE